MIIIKYNIQMISQPFCRKHFPYKSAEISLNAGFTCPNRDGTKDGAVVRIAITRLSTRTIAGRKSRLLPNWRRGNVSLPINIRR